MKNLLLVLALVSLAACKSDYREKTTDRVLSQPPTNPTGSVGYQGAGGTTARQDSAPPANPTGSVQPQRSGPGAPATLEAAPPKSPTGSVGYQY